MIGYKFKRQYSVDQYVIDFYCPKLKLAVEIDGSGHNSSEQKKYDADRRDLELVLYVSQMKSCSLIQTKHLVK